jgi:hypothetical protein
MTLFSTSYLLPQVAIWASSANDFVVTWVTNPQLKTVRRAPQPMFSVFSKLRRSR